MGYCVFSAVIGIPKLSAKDKNVFSEERHSEVSAFPTKKQSTSRWETPFTLNLEFIIHCNAEEND